LKRLERRRWRRARSLAIDVKGANIVNYSAAAERQMPRGWRL